MPRRRDDQHWRQGIEPARGQKKPLLGREHWFSGRWRCRNLKRSCVGRPPGLQCRRRDIAGDTSGDRAGS